MDSEEFQRRINGEVGKLFEKNVLKTTKGRHPRRLVRVPVSMFFLRPIKEYKFIEVNTGDKFSTLLAKIESCISEDLLYKSKKKYTKDDTFQYSLCFDEAKVKFDCSKVDETKLRDYNLFESSIEDVIKSMPPKTNLKFVIDLISHNDNSFNENILIDQKTSYNVELESNIFKEKEKIEALKLKYRKNSVELINLKKSNRELKKRIDHDNEKYKLKSDYEKLANNYKNREKELNRERKSKNKLKKEKEDLEKKNKTLVTDVNRKKSEVEKMKKTVVADFEKKLTSSNNHYQNMKLKHDNLLSDVKTLKSELVAAKKDVEGLSKKNNRLQKEIKEQKNRMLSKYKKDLAMSIKKYEGQSRYYRDEMKRKDVDSRHYDISGRNKRDDDNFFKNVFKELDSVKTSNEKLEDRNHKSKVKLHNAKNDYDSEKSVNEKRLVKLEDEIKRQERKKDEFRKDYKKAVHRLGKFKKSKINKGFFISSSSEEEGEEVIVDIGLGEVEVEKSREKKSNSLSFVNSAIEEALEVEGKSIPVSKEENTTSANVVEQQIQKSHSNTTSKHNYVENPTWNSSGGNRGIIYYDKQNYDNDNKYKDTWGKPWKNKSSNPQRKWRPQNPQQNYDYRQRKWNSRGNSNMPRGRNMQKKWNKGNTKWRDGNKSKWNNQGGWDKK